MKKNVFYRSLDYCLDKLKKKKVIAYPTESIFGLGCDPDSEIAMYSLLRIKERSIQKGVILVSSNFLQLFPYIDFSKLSCENIKTLLKNWPGPVTFLLPAKEKTPFWLTGDSDFLAVRVSSHKEIYQLCELFGKPIVSTSANISGKYPCKKKREVLHEFKKKVSILNGKVGNLPCPSRIVNIFDGKIIRK